MHKDQSISDLTSIRSRHNHTYQILNFMGSVALLLASTASFALAPNPGAVCSTNFAKGSFTNSDYTNLASAVNTTNYVDITGSASGSIPLQVRMTTSESSSSPISGSFDSVTIGSNSAFNIVRDFPSVTSVTSVDLDFRNKVTEQPLFLTNVALSAFDIDYANNNSNSFDDYILFTGITASGNTIDGAFQSVEVSGSNIRAFRDLRPNTAGLGLYTVNTNTSTECPGTNLDTECQGSVQFSEPVRSVKVRYSNANFRLNQTNPTNQQTFFRMDNYCYIPEYIFSGTVFNDNGGVTDAQADADNANITSGNYSNKPNYFNGIFNTPQESGITGSTVKLANCTNTATTYTTQSVIKNGAPVGAYQISIPRTTLANNTNLCLIESRTGSTYPIRTNGDRRTIGFSATTYNYPDNNFGRVIAENLALVLRKSQYINDCPATLNYSSINDSTSPLTGFSTSTIENIEPSKCIAYKITATNRANMNIDNFIMEDILQKKGTNSAIATSLITNPALSTTDYTTDSPAIGENGTVKTRPFMLSPRTKRDFYFNTKYGNSQ